MSKFTVESTKDGHHSVYLIPVERASSDPGGPVANQLYYNTVDTFIYIYYSSAWVLLAETHLQYLKSYAGGTLCEQLYDVRTILYDAEKTWDAVDTDYEGSVSDKAQKKWFPIWDSEERQKTAQLAFYGGSEAKARDMLRTLTNRS